MRALLIPAFLLCGVPLLVPAAAPPSPPAVNGWERLGPAFAGARRDVPLVYSPELRRFLVVGGRTHFADYRRQPRPYDELALDLAEGKWENWYPRGKSWGPRFGPCKAPSWKDERFGFRDVEGNVRPNWTVYGTFSLTAYALDGTTGQVVFYAGGHTFAYDPVRRAWRDLAPANHPEKELGGRLLWASMCYDGHNQQFVLFGGGNVQSASGGPGTWLYSPARNAWERSKLDREPPARANSQLVYDPVRRKVILFGGDRLNALLADTWEFDVVARRWEERRPPRSPAPRAGHALLWLPAAKKVLLLGGYGYTSTTDYVAPMYRRLPLEAWAYDGAAGRWALVKRFGPAPRVPQGPANGPLPAAAGPGDEVLAVADGTWRCRLAVTEDAAGTKRLGVPPGTTEMRTGPYDPAWYRRGVPPVEPTKVAAELAALPPNRWAVRPTPKLPGPNMDWGSAVFAPDLDLILRFSGGHSAYSGTAPQVYDVKTDRYSIPFAPELPIEYVYSNDQVGGEWAFSGSPWMTGHTYKSTGYEPGLKALVFAPHEYTYFFDPKKGHWWRGRERAPFAPNFYVVTVCATPKGAVVWADRKGGGGGGLWRWSVKEGRWLVLPLEGPLPAKSPDRHGMAYDGKRDRLLLFSNVGPEAGDVAAYDLKTGRSRWLKAAGRERAKVPARETAYLPEADAVLVGARVAVEGKMLWALYDCSANAWRGVELGGADPIARGVFNNSMGLMYDPSRKLVWAVGQNSHVHVLRLNVGKARAVGLR